MPIYKYTVKRGPKEVVEGRIEAETQSQAVAQLTEQGLTPIRIAEEAVLKPEPVAAATSGAPVARGGRVKMRDLNAFTRQFASLVRSGVPLLRALTILSEQTHSTVLRGVLGGLTESVRQGETLSASMARYPRVFPPLYISLIYAGEVGGVLDAVMDRLAAQAERDEAMRAKIQAALVYPAFVGLVGLGTIVFLMTFVMPRLLKLFSSYGERLPGPTRLLIAVSGLMRTWWFWAIAIGVAVAIISAWKAPGSKLRLSVQRLLLRLPIVGDLCYQLEYTRFARAFGLLLDHGVPILKTVEVAAGVVHHPVIREALRPLPESIRQGNTLGASLKAIPVMNAFIVNSITVGEEGGRAGESFIEVADFYEREVERLLQTLAALLEPVMVLAVGALIGWMVFAVLLPIFELSSMV